MTLDPRLIGFWTSTQPGTIEITAAGELFVARAPWPYSISSDDSTLTNLNTNPLWQVTRLTGSGTPVGLWERYETDSDGTWREEWLMRADGTYTYHWSLDGVFDSEGIGTFTFDATHITSRERYTAISTNAPNQCIIAPYHGTMIVGTYSVAADGSSWTFHGPSGDAVYNRAP